jgi:hypothetical protein
MTEARSYRAPLRVTDGRRAECTECPVNRHSRRAPAPAGPPIRRAEPMRPHGRAAQTRAVAAGNPERFG